MSLVTTPRAGSLGLADLEAMPEDGRRYELIDGAIVMTAAPVPLHQLVSLRLVERLLAEDVLPEGHTLFFAPIDLDLPNGQRVEPDLVVVPWASVGEQRLTLPVALVVEIVSPGSRTNDRVTKRAAYAEAGIPAYWLIDLPAGRITALGLSEAGTYETIAEGTSITVAAPLAVTLDLNELTHRPGPSTS